ncbi:MAG: GTPase ObgE [Chloroflexi bacterium]|nr:GTPase ObgE [Chloroflexota bacterium]MCY3937185.1 GTPase ObgE [Chloroflexota bacterium]
MPRFYDTARIYVAAGRGGDGSRSLRREKFVPKGGPDGGDGGRGGHVILYAVAGDSSLVRFHHRQRFKAGNALPGGSSHRSGKNGEDRRISAPAGTVVFGGDDDELIGDLVNPGDELIVARGGQGGLGNAHFKSSVNQTPQIALKGDSGESKWLRLELKLVADVGLVGCPNAGKSSLLARISAAHPKVAAYPFTTLTPVLGSVLLGDRSLVVADIPGLIEGSHDGAGLGHEFLRHVERTRFIVHVIDCSGISGDPIALFDQTANELEAYSPELAERPYVVAANKMDLSEAKADWPSVKDALAERGVKAFAVSAATGQGLQELVQAIFAQALQAPVPTVLHGAGEVVLRPGLGSAAPSARRIGPDLVLLESDEARRLAARVELDIPDAAQWFRKQLERMGAAAALERAGVKPGDTVIAGETEFDWL